jgi:hypothetical protein
MCLGLIAAALIQAYGEDDQEAAVLVFEPVP